MKRILAFRPVLGSVLVLALVLASILLAAVLDSKDAGDATPPFNETLFKKLMSGQFTSIEDLVQDYEFQQSCWLFIVPPGDEPWTQPAGIAPFSPDGFPKEFIEALVPDERDGITVYPVIVYEDPVTRDRVVLNAKLDQVASAWPPKDYDPEWFLQELHPDLRDGKHSEGQVEFLRKLYDPSRIVLRYDLILEEDLIKYVWKRSIEAAVGEKSGGQMMLMDWGGGSVSNIQFVRIEPASNGVQVTIAYPDDYANDLDVFTCSDLIEFWWDWADTISVSGTNYVEWTDTGATGVSPRFYAAGNAQTNGVTDPDSDGLTWAREKYMYHTCPTNWDSDGDTLSDYEEVISLNTDPNNDDTNRPTAVMVFPPDGYRWVWMP